MAESRCPFPGALWLWRGEGAHIVADLYIVASSCCVLQKDSGWPVSGQQQTGVDRELAQGRGALQSWQVLRLVPAQGVRDEELAALDTRTHIKIMIASQIRVCVFVFSSQLNMSCVVLWDYVQCVCFCPFRASAQDIRGLLNKGRLYFIFNYYLIEPQIFQGLFSLLWRKMEFMGSHLSKLCNCFGII